MKVLKYICTLILALTLFSCDDTTYSDPHLMPVRVPGLRIRNLSLVKPVFDGTVAFPISENGGVKIAKVMRDGNVSYSELAADMDFDDFSVNISGECLLVHREKVVKFDRFGKITINSSIPEYNGVNNPILLDNGDISYVDWNTNNEMVLHTLGNNFPYVIKNGDWMYVLPFDDKWFVFNNYSSVFCICDADGNVLSDGELEGSVYSIKYIDGYLYILEDGGFADIESGLDYITKWSIVKMTTDGRIIYSTEIEISDIYNLSIHDDKVLITGDVIVDITKDGKYGEICILNDVNGNIISTISTDEYNGCSIVPIYVSPDPRGEYDVYAARLEAYESNLAQLVIYHTDDLSKLNIKN